MNPSETAARDANGGRITLTERQTAVESGGPAPDRASLDLLGEAGRA